MKKITLLFFVVFIFFSIKSYSQQLNISTVFKNTVYIPKHNSSTKMIKCNVNETCEVVMYEGKDLWIIKYKKSYGSVESKNLEMNMEMKGVLEKHNSKIRARDSLKRFTKKLKQKAIYFERKKNSDSLYKLSLLKEKNRLKNDSLILIKREKKELDRIEKRVNDCHYTKNEKDKFDNVLIKNTEYYGLNNYDSFYDDFMIGLGSYNDSKRVYIKVFWELGCVSPYSYDRSYVKFKLENNDIITFYHSGEVDCGDFVLSGKLSKAEISRLKKSPIKSIRVRGTKFYKDIEEIKFKTFFIDKLSCIE